jgi:hypothetical protein
MLRVLLFLGLSLAPLRATDILTTLHGGHPRLIATAEAMAQARRNIQADPRARAIYDRLVRQAAALEGTAPVTYDKPGRQLLRQSRAAVERVYTLALLYRLDSHEKYAARAIRELEAAAAFPDWNPSHFLDTAEMTHAFAIGYDWLYDALTPEQRTWMRRAIVSKGLDQALPIYRERRWWSANVFNWNQVCNGGIGLGALAIADEEPEKAREVLEFALASIRPAIASYGPDGGWAEGPGYWHYASRYTAYFLAGLKSALGSDFGLSAIPGLDRAGHFRIHMVAPSGKQFNFADSNPRPSPAAEMFWLARRFSEPVYAHQQHRLLAQAEKAEALDLIWYQPESRSPSEAGWPLDACFRGVEVATMRGSWTDPDAVFAALKAGTIRRGRGHAHYDLGSFVFEAGGVRFATDLGADSYLDGYFGDRRLTFYRTRTEAHNTLVFDGGNQDQQGSAAIVRRRFRPDSAWAIVDLAKAWAGKVTRYERGIALVERRHLVVQDEFEAPSPVEAQWGMVTEAEVELEARTAHLSSGEWKATARILSPDGAVFRMASTATPPPQNPNRGTARLVIELPRKSVKERIVVAITPHAKAERPPALSWAGRSLADWN